MSKTTGICRAIPPDLSEAATPELLGKARSEPGDQGRIENWSIAWATDTVLAAQEAFFGASFAPNSNGKGRTISFADRDAHFRAADVLKRKQLAKAGARLAELLNAIWP
jgi:hypothetical protein